MSCEFGHSAVLIVWYLCYVPNLVQVSVIVTEIGAHNASDIHSMTSRELTSGFDFCSRGHLRIAVMHLSIKFGAGIFIQSAVIDIFFRNSRWRQPPSWIFRLCVFGHSGVLIVWCLCSVPNCVQMYCDNDDADETKIC